MKCLDVTLPDPPANLALEEALLDACEDGLAGETLRFWEPRHHFVVAGYANKIAREVNVEACRRDHVGIYRRCSGGGTVLQGPGCLNYSLVLQIDGHEALSTITGANCHIMQRQRDVISSLLGRPVRIEGHTDLALDGLKFSGNAQRRKRRALIFHGTFLLGFDLSLMETWLAMPTREPDYRRGRPHQLFLTNLALDAETVKAALRRAWSAEEPLESTPDYRPLVAEKYGLDEWNLKF